VPWSPLPTSDARRGAAPEPLASALDVVLASLGGPSREAIVVVHERWPEVVGAEVAEHARPLAIESGRLRIGVDSPGWASHLRWSEGEIVARIAHLVGEGQVTSVQVRVAAR
jgi:predicted nucleic acid-binding Zn ribbon protein